MLHIFVCSVKKEASLTTCGSEWVRRMCLCIREENPNHWRPSSTSTLSSSARRSPAPTRSPWMRGRCFSRLLRWAWTRIWSDWTGMNWIHPSLSDVFVLACVRRWARSRRSWRLTSTWSSRSAAASCPSPAPAALGWGDWNQPRLQARERWNYQREKKSLCLSRKHEHTERGGMREDSETAGPQFTWGNFSHCSKAQQILQSCDLIPPLMLAPPMLAFSLISVFSPSSSPAQKPSSFLLHCSYCFPAPDFTVLGTKWTPPYESHWEPFFKAHATYLFIYLLTGYLFIDHQSVSERLKSQLKSVRLKWTWISSVQLKRNWLSWTQINLIQFSSMKMASVELKSTEINSEQLNAAQINSIHLSQLN